MGPGILMCTQCPFPYTVSPRAWLFLARQEHCIWQRMSISGMCFHNSPRLSCLTHSGRCPSMLSRSRGACGVCLPQFGRLIAYWVLGIAIPPGLLTTAFFLPNSRQGPTASHAQLEFHPRQGTGCWLRSAFRLVDCLVRWDHVGKNPGVLLVVLAQSFDIDRQVL